MINTLLEHVPIKMEVKDVEDGTENLKNKEDDVQDDDKITTDSENEDMTEDEDEEEDEEDDEEEESETETDALEIEQEAIMLISSDEEAELEAQRIRFPNVISKKSSRDSKTSSRSSSRNSQVSCDSGSSQKKPQEIVDKVVEDKKQRTSARNKKEDKSTISVENNHKEANNTNVQPIKEGENNKKVENNKKIETNKKLDSKKNVENGKTIVEKTIKLAITNKTVKNNKVETKKLETQTKLETTKSMECTKVVEKNIRVENSKKLDQPTKPVPHKNLELNLTPEIPKEKEISKITESVESPKEATKIVNLDSNKSLQTNNNLENNKNSSEIIKSSSDIISKNTENNQNLDNLPLSRRQSSNSTCSVASTVASDTAETESCGNIYVFNLQQKLIFNCEFCDLKYDDLENFGSHLHEAHKIFHFDEDPEKENAPRNKRNSNRNSPNKTQNQNNLKNVKKEPLQESSPTATVAPVALPLSCFAEPLESCGNVFTLNHRKLFLVCGYCECKYANLDLFEKHLRQQHRIFEGGRNEVNVVPKVEIKEEFISSEVVEKPDIISPMVAIPAEIPLDISITADSEIEEIATNDIAAKETIPFANDLQITNLAKNNVETIVLATIVEEPITNLMPIVLPPIILKSNTNSQNIDIVRAKDIEIQEVTNVVLNSPKKPRRKRRSSPVKPSKSPSKRPKRNSRPKIEPETTTTKPIEETQSTELIKTTAVATKTTNNEISIKIETITSLEPNKSLEGEKSTETTNPQATKLTESKQPKETNLSETIKPLDTTISSNSDKPAGDATNPKATNSMEGNKSADAAKLKPTKRSETIKSVEPTKSAETSKSKVNKKDRTKSSDGDKAGDAAKPKATKRSEPIKSSDEGKSAITSKPKAVKSEPSNTSVVSKSADTSKPKATLSLEPIKSSDADISANTIKPKATKTSDSIKSLDKSAEPSKPKATKIAETIKSLEPSSSLEGLKPNATKITETLNNKPKSTQPLETIMSLEPTNSSIEPKSVDNIKPKATKISEPTNTAQSDKSAETAKPKAARKSTAKRKSSINTKKKLEADTSIASAEKPTEPQPILITRIETIQNETQIPGQAEKTSTPIAPPVKKRRRTVKAKKEAPATTPPSPLKGPCITDIIPIQQQASKQYYVDHTTPDEMNIDPVDDIIEQLQNEIQENQQRQSSVVQTDLITFTINSIDEAEVLNASFMGLEGKTSHSPMPQIKSQHNLKSPVDIKPFLMGVMDRFACDECPRSFKKRARLVEHKRVHTGETPFQCDLCDKQFRIRMRLNEHKSRHAKEKKFKCEVCGLGCCTRQDLNLHMRHHTNDRRFKCTWCPKAFVRSSDLKIHVRVHTGEKPFVCDICNKCFRANQNLFIHKKSHMGESSKTYQCEHCDKKFMRNIDRKVHMRSHTGEKPYKCEICDRGYSSRFNVRAHLQRDHIAGNKPKKTGPKPKALRDELDKQKKLIEELQQQLLQQIKTDEKIIQSEEQLPIQQEPPPASSLLTPIATHDQLQTAYDILNQLTATSAPSKPLTVIPSPPASTITSNPFTKSQKSPTTLLPLTITQKIEQHSSSASSSSSCLNTPSPPKTTATKVVSQKTSMGIQQVSVTVSMQVENVTSAQPITPEKENAGILTTSPTGASSVKKERKITSYFTVVGQKAEVMK